ncbi:60Kd inner membrane protein-domain-containing protein [Terfezia claveryi]|nr:60Kd inner membrane protein-domain-containing protein [Terfezia claveryi]
MPPPRLPRTLLCLQSPLQPIHHLPPRLAPLLLRSPRLLPPQFHPSPYPLLCHHQTRTFLTSLLQGTSSVLTTISTVAAPLTTTGLAPWYLLLPLSALVLRTTTTLPLTLYARRICISLITLRPLLSAWGRVIGTGVARSKTDTTLTPFEWERQTRDKIKLQEKELQKTFGCESWKGYLPMLQVPIWVIASLTLRGMTTEPSSVTVARNLPLPPLPLPGQVEGVAGAVAGTDISSSSPSSPGYLQSLLDSIPLEPTFSHGGALWFPDLLAPDPLYLLPIMLSLSMFANIEFQALQYPPTTNRGRIIKNILRAFALGVIPVTIQTPVALTLYWLSSSLYSLVQNIVLHFAYPMPKAVTPCKPKSLIGYEAQETPSQ